MPAWRMRDDGIEIAVRVTPRAKRAQFAAGTEEHFAVRLAAPPVEGAANTALIALVAKQFDVGKRAVTLIAGETSRLKRLAIAGDATALAERAASHYGDTP
ncbi:DUF167 domain-containing protein [Stakelama tenebrarum]|uniref:UPF0235 protein G5C33_18840 n=1 Tax=Stakelama tenebrarum TaxID=2711215 RepID=A0A6G6Y9P6_9SPHN|nr:DUF167 domain-containing protein [Sphingosinithalassobacter tenebrarum]QIG81639.1 DUF167 domain-containing protein [Sphingosinithalassobacter tenebrarum]